MTPAPAPAAPTSSKPMFAGMVIGGLIGLMLTTCVGGVGGYVLLQKKESDLRRDWTLVPVVVAAVDISGGTTVTYDMLTQRSLPGQFVTASVVTPDSASYVVNQKLLVPVLAGDPLLWTQFETKKK